MSRQVLTVVGARPQFVKAAAVSRAWGEGCPGKVRESIVHTGQHHDHNMSAVFFEELGIPPPAYNLGVAGGGHGAMTGRMLERLEAVMLETRPDLVLVYGDTNSTLAASLAAVKLHIPVAHVEAGLRSHNMRMPEEVNRILSDRVSALRFCPTDIAVRNLEQEGMADGVHQVGDVMYDVALFHAAQARAESRVMQSLGLEAGHFVLATCHRAENTDDPARLRGVIEGLARVARHIPVVLPLHPRTRRILADGGLADGLGAVQVTDPLPFLDMVQLEQGAAVVVTDSGGVQKEALFFGVPCVTMRDETEWLETVQLGVNVLVGADAGRIEAAVRAALADGFRLPREVQPYGDGRAAVRIARIIGDFLTA